MVPVWGGGVSEDDFREVTKRRSKTLLRNAFRKTPRILSFTRVQGALDSFPLYPRPGCSSRRVLWGRATAAREDSHVAPAVGSAPGPAALIGQWLPGPGKHLSTVQTKGSMCSHEGNSPSCRSRVLAPRTQTPRSSASPRGPWLAANAVSLLPTLAALTSALVALPPSAFWALAPQQLPSSHSHPSLALSRVPPLSPVAPPPLLVTAPYPKPRPF